MKLLSFLGTAPYRETCYTYLDRSHTSRFSIAASCRFLGADTVVLFLTEEAHQQYAGLIRAELPEDVHLVNMPVPLGRNETELWDIFRLVSASVAPGEEVAFDVTNGLRSFPLIGLLAAAFLRSALDVELKAVLYGAYDVRDQTVTPNLTSMFDLSPMIALLEWSSAADRFNRSGDARDLAGLVKQHRKKLDVAAGKDHALIDQAGALGSLATGLTEISQGIHLNRPVQVMKSCADLPSRIGNARPALDRAAAALPFDLILGKVAERFSPLGLTDPMEPENFTEMLGQQRQIINRCAEWELWVQAITLAREWLLTWFMVRAGMSDLEAVGRRKEMEERVNSESYQLRTASKKGLPLPPLAKSVDGREGLNLWSMITNTRNDIDHAGMREEPGQPADLIDSIGKILTLLNKLELPTAP